MCFRKKFVLCILFLQKSPGVWDLEVKKTKMAESTPCCIYPARFGNLSAHTNTPIGRISSAIRPGRKKLFYIDSFSSRPPRPCDGTTPIWYASLTFCKTRFLVNNILWTYQSELFNHVLFIRRFQVFLCLARHHIIYVFPACCDNDSASE